MGLIQQFFIFYDFIKFLWMFFRAKHTKQHNLHGEVGIFPHLTMKVCCDLKRGIGPELHPQIRREHCLTLFYVGSGDLGLRF